MSMLMLNNKNTTGASISIHLHEYNDKHTVEGDYLDPDSGVTAMTVVLEGAATPRIPDASCIWFPLMTYALTATDITNKNFMFFTVSKNIGRVRVNITVLTGADANTKINIRYVPNVKV